MRDGVSIGHIMGIEVRIHPSWLLVLAVIALAIGGSGLSTIYPAWPVPVPWIVGAAASALYAASIAVHELAHAFVVRRRGGTVRSISLHAFGGTASIDTPARTPTDEALVGIAGPVASLLLAAAFALAAGVVSAGVPSGTAGEATAAVGLFVATLNFVVGLVNLVPSYPMDGGRILRALVWRMTGSVRRGTRAAARSGRWLGYLLAMSGLVLLFIGDRFDGAVILLGGWILRGAATSALRTADVEELLEGVSVRDVMETEVATVAPYLTLDVISDELLAGTEHASVAVRDDGRLVGLLGVSQVRGIRRAALRATRVADRMVRLASLPVLAPDDPIWHGVEELHRTGFDGLPVMEEADLLGVLTRASVSRAVRSRVAARLAVVR